MVVALFFLFKQKTAYEMRISDWSSDVCSSDLAFRKVVQRDGDDEQPDAAELCRRRAFRPADEVLVRGVAVDQPEAGSAEQDAGNDDGDGGHFAGAPRLGGLETRQDDRADARKSVVPGKSVEGLVEIGGGGVIKKKNITK